MRRMEIFQGGYAVQKMNKKLVLVGLLFICLASSLAINIDNEVEEKLSDNKEVSVIIKLKDEPTKQETFGIASKKEILGKKLKTKKLIIKIKQDKVLSRLNIISKNKRFSKKRKFSKIKKPDFKLKHKYSTVNAFSGKITQQSLEKLKQDPNVESIFIDKPVYTTLDQSIPQINASSVWQLQLDSTNITGAGETICIIDTGIDYTQPALGECNITNLILNGTTENLTTPIESAHNYASNFDYTWNITKPGYTKIAVHFRNLSTESNYDYIILYDNNSREIASYSGLHQDLWSPHSEGDTIYIRLLTDTFVTNYGFYIDSVINGTTNTTYNWSNCSKVIDGWDFVNSDGNPIDDEGHGTHVAGIVSSDNETYKGVAPDAKLIAIKALDNSGSGFFSDIIAGIDWCINRSDDLNISVISMSLGDQTEHNSYCNNHATTSPIDSAVGQGILVAIAAGNCDWGGANCTNGISAPACVQNATPIGTVNDTDSIYYQRTNILDILAPGIDINSTQLNGGFVSYSGTSMSTPHVAGAAALIKQFVRLQNGSDITPQEIEETLNNTGKRIYDTGTSRNYSRIDIYAAIISLDNIPPNLTFISPTLANGTITNQTNITINITSSETLSTALLEFNGTNTTMNGSNTNWFLIKTNLNGWNNFTVYANDSAGNWGSAQLTVRFNNTAPNITSFYPNTTTINITEPQNQTFNITYGDRDNDTITALWQLNGSNISTSVNYTFLGNYTSAGSYNITVTISDGGLTDSQTWNLTINNTNRISIVQNATLISTDSSNRTNGTLQGSWTFYDLDNDTQTDNETIWYNNTIEVPELNNLTITNSSYTRRNQNWTFSVRVYDGTDWSNWTNSTHLTIQNLPPILAIIENITINETQLVNITANVTDEDNLTYGINDSRFSQSVNIFTWQTNLTDSGNYTIRINVTDGTDLDYQDIIITVLNALDSDDDGNPDFNDTDDDNDGLNDTIDFLLGNVSSINTTQNISLSINSSTNTTQLFNGTFNINVTEDNTSILYFNFNITNTTTLNLYNISITTGSDYIIISGVPNNGLISKKTIRLNDSSASITAVCIKDAEISSISNISSNCDGSAETLVLCNGNNYSGYSCADEGTKYLVTGLNHSAVKELCQDSDSDGYTSTSCGGNDCNDNNAVINPGASDTCGNGIDEDCSGSDSTCPTTTNGGGGGGGGGSVSKAVSPTTGKSQYYSIITKDSSAKLGIDKTSVAVTNINFTVNKQLSRVTLSIETVNESEAPSKLANTYNYFKISLDKAEITDIDNAVFNFRINNTWLKEYDKNSVSLNRYTNSWTKLDTILVDEDSDYTYYKSTSPGFSYFAITAEKPKLKPIEEAPIRKAPVRIAEEEIVETKEVEQLAEEEIEAVELAPKEFIEPEEEIAEEKDKTKVIVLMLVIIFTIIASIIFLILKSEFLYDFWFYLRNR